MELFVDRTKVNQDVLRGLQDFCKGLNVSFVVHETNDIHDRVWIRDDSEAIVVGTSFNSIGEKCAFILPLPGEDLRDFRSELEKIRHEKGP